jgi:hypothetical protein
MSAEASPFDGSDDEGAAEPAATGRWLSELAVADATYVDDDEPSPADLDRSRDGGTVAAAERPNDHASRPSDAGHPLPQLFDAFFAEAAAAQRAEDAGDLAAAVVSFGNALASLTAAIPFQDALSGASGTGDPRASSLLREKHREFTARRHAACAALAGKGAAREAAAASEAAADEAASHAAADEAASHAAQVAEAEAQCAVHGAAARRALAQALELDEASRPEDALPLYLQAAESYLGALAALNALPPPLQPAKANGASPGAVAAAVRTAASAAAAVAAAERQKASAAALRAQAVQVLDRVDAIKRAALLESELDDETPALATPADSSADEAAGSAAAAARRFGDALLPPAAPLALPPPQLAVAPLATVGGGSSSSHGCGPSSSGSGLRLSPAEIDVLRRTSRVHGRLFLPWGSDDPKAERFSYAAPWCDPEGLLPLSTKQQAALGGWRRPSEFVSDGGGAGPVMIATVSPLVITQDLVGDCSFVASLCITAAFERRFRRRLITGIIWPQNAAGMPVYNPSGKVIENRSTRAPLHSRARCAGLSFSHAPLTDTDSLTLNSSLWKN